MHRFLYQRELQLGRGLPKIHIDLSHPIPFICLSDSTSNRIRAATWKIHWPEINRGTCACVGVSIHPNSPDSPVDKLLYLDLAKWSPSQSEIRSRGKILLFGSSRLLVLNKMYCSKPVFPIQILAYRQPTSS